ncbi:nuclear pore complex protein [Seminavis robusta]|uniref:Nuclear pore complex protein n=1 Tax=Seminavis robusta TaxID=568900 RepID=A0A9N8EG16_9STRA|nr:nuclear pore complex protein [Seminavis robusta]|eukprot:Sro1135_g245020.1 nuclear pore complex protein (672) ;mRNA; f:8443-10458
MFGAPPPEDQGSVSPNGSGSSNARPFGFDADGNRYNSQAFSGAPPPRDNFGSPPWQAPNLNGLGRNAAGTTGSVFGSPGLGSTFQNSGSGGRLTANLNGNGASRFYGTKNTPYYPTDCWDGTMYSITAMATFEHNSFDELRFEDYLQGNRGLGRLQAQFNNRDTPLDHFGSPTLSNSSPTASVFSSGSPSVFGAPASSFGAAHTDATAWTTGPAGNNRGTRAEPFGAAAGYNNSATGVPNSSPSSFSLFGAPAPSQPQNGNANAASSGPRAAPTGPAFFRMPFAASTQSNHSPVPAGPGSAPVQIAATAGFGTSPAAASGLLALSSSSFRDDDSTGTATGGSSPRGLDSLWRKDPKESFSDWMLKVKTKSSEENDKVVVHTYHIHKAVVAFGKSELLAELCHQDQEGAVLVQLEPLGAKAVPLLLDFLYSPEEPFQMDVEDAVALHYLGKVFKVEQLCNGAKNFCQNEMARSLENIPSILAAASMLPVDDDGIKQLVVDFIGTTNLLRLPTDSSLLESFDPNFWLDVQDKLVGNGVTPKPLSLHWSLLMGHFAQLHKEELKFGKFFKLLTNDEQAMPFVALEVALELCEVQQDLLSGEQGVEAEGELSSLEKRCASAIASNWRSIDFASDGPVSEERVKQRGCEFMWAVLNETMKNAKDASFCGSPFGANN